MQRHITRDPSKCTDLEVPVSLDEFNAMEANGDFAFAWDAHGTRYALNK